MLAPINSPYHPSTLEMPSPDQISYPHSEEAKSQNHCFSASGTATYSYAECLAPPTDGFVPRRNSLKVTFREDIRRTRHEHVLASESFPQQQHAENGVLYSSNSLPDERTCEDQNGLLRENSEAYVLTEAKQLADHTLDAEHSYQNGLTNKKPPCTYTNGHGDSPFTQALPPPASNGISSPSASILPTRQTGHRRNFSSWACASGYHGVVHGFDNLRAEADLIGPLL